MAVTVISVTQLALGTESADILSTDGVVATTPSDGWTVTPPAGCTFDQLFFRLLADGTGDTFVFTAGDKPPAERAGLGSLSVVMAASDERTIVIEDARHVKTAGHVLITCTDTGSKLLVFAMPKGIGHGTPLA